MNLLYIIPVMLLGFFNPSIKLPSNRNVKLSGSGPPLLFSPGLFGTMPPFIYSDFLNKLKNNLTIITFDDFLPINDKDIYEITDTLCVDSIAYVSHSSFNPKILESERINRAILFDPICLPTLTPFSVNNQEINVPFPTLVVKAERLYDSEPSLPNWQSPKLNGNITEIKYDNMGHPDILDDFWANFAKTNGFWDTTNGEIQPFQDWKYDKNSLRKIRDEYRDYLSKTSLDFIFS